MAIHKEVFCTYRGSKIFNSNRECVLFLVRDGNFTSNCRRRSNKHIQIFQSQSRQQMHTNKQLLMSIRHVIKTFYFLHHEMYVSTRIIFIPHSDTPSYTFACATLNEE